MITFKDNRKPLHYTERLPVLVVGQNLDLDIVCECSNQEELPEILPLLGDIGKVINPALTRDKKIFWDYLVTYLKDEQEYDPNLPIQFSVLEDNVKAMDEKYKNFKYPSM